jgi:hypothetical protein
VTIKAIKNTIGTGDALPPVPNKCVEKVERLSCFLLRSRRRLPRMGMLQEKS